MKTCRALIMFLIFSLVLGGVSPAFASPASTHVSKDRATLALNQPDAPDDYPILECNANGITGDLADMRGIVFTPPSGFSKLVVRMAATVAGSYYFDAELRRSGGFTDAAEVTKNVTASVTGNTQSYPYTPVTIDFGSISAKGNENFSLRFTNIKGQGTLYFETYGIGNKPCANVMETNENNVAIPTERGDPAGFQVFAGGTTPALVASLGSPVIDGVINYGEWDFTHTLKFANGLITVRNDGLRMYVLLDVIGDTVENSIRSVDYFYLTFDKNKDAAITPNVDLNYTYPVSSTNLRYQYYLGPNEWTGMQPDTFSSRAAGFGCFYADGSLSFTQFPLRKNCSRHRLWELAIDLDEIGAAPGSSVKMGVLVSSPNPIINDEIPVNFTADFSNLITVVLANWPGFVLAPTPGAVITLESQAIEITQAIQDRNNTLSLVADKKTAARMYVDVNGTTSSQTAKAFLYGSQSGTDLPGSPLSMWHTAPATINRNTTNNTANFTLPSTWDQGTVTFSGRVKDLLGNVHSSSPFPLAFTAREIPNYWIVPINTGSNASPVVVSNTTISDQEGYQRALYPVPEINFTRKPWQDIGPTTVNATIGDLNEYHTGVVLAWLVSVLFTGKQPYTLPDQIYGFTPSGGGISDPTWIGAGGYVARGYLGTSLEGTMAHEINHNLDRSSSGTWGRHVPAGCSAAGPDPAWPYSNDDIQETGFDTRSMKVVPSTYPDMMSYCQSGSTPTKWISPYRWSNLFNTFSVSLNSQMLEQPLAPQTVYYVSGHVNVDGTGILDPALTQPGIPTTGITAGDYAVEVRGAGGTLLSSLPFQAQFVEMEPGETINTVYFNFQILANVAAEKLVLTYKGNILDEIKVSAHAPVVKITSPNGGETWQGHGTATWTASDLDGDPLTYTVLYSPDGGSIWYPISSGITSTSLDVDATSLPGSTNAIIKVIVTDGINTGEDVSDAPFIVTDNPPNVYITSPAPKTLVTPETQVSLEGEATDPEDGSIPDDSIYWSEGETVLGVGQQVTATLAPGWHALTLTAVDSSGKSAQASVDVFVGYQIFLPTLFR